MLLNPFSGKLLALLGGKRARYSATTGRVGMSRGLMSDNERSIVTLKSAAMAPADFSIMEEVVVMQV